MYHIRRCTYEAAYMSGRNSDAHALTHNTSTRPHVPMYPRPHVHTHAIQFAPHTDGHTLTVLMPLTSSKDASGGGTGFCKY